MATKIATPCRGSHTSPIANGSDATWSQEKRAKGAVTAPKTKAESKKSTSEDSLLAYICAQICEHQLGTFTCVVGPMHKKTANLCAPGVSVNLLLLLALTHSFVPRARRRTSTFFRLSYYNAETDLYGIGIDDFPFLVLWLVIFTGLRVAVMEYILGPIAGCSGIKTIKGLARFKEQAWLVCYCICSWSLGMVCTVCKRRGNMLTKDSTLSTTLSTGSTSMDCGKDGHSVRSTASPSSTTLLSLLFGYNKSSWSTLKRNERTITRCSRTTSSPALFSFFPTDSTTRVLES